jgi:hypothetical protein
LVIEPAHEPLKTDHDVVILLGDWLHRSPEEVFAQLRSGTPSSGTMKMSGWRWQASSYESHSERATAADLAAGNATHLGMSSDDYAPCADNGQNCANDIYAVSLPGVPPSAFLTWFQAQAACKNSGKRLPTNAEWQAAANGTPDPGTDNGSTDCDTTSTTYYLPEDPVNTGSRSNCVSARGAYDMVGNVVEFVAAWVPRSTDCPNWGAFSNDTMCLSGASTTATAPGRCCVAAFSPTARVPARPESSPPNPAKPRWASDSAARASHTLAKECGA